MFFTKKDMNRKLLVSLLQKNIQELEMITEGFMEMSEFPKSIIMLAKQKTEDIQEYIQQLSGSDLESPVMEIKEVKEINSDIETVISTNHNIETPVSKPENGIRVIAENETNNVVSEETEVTLTSILQEETSNNTDSKTSLTIEQSTTTFQSRNEQISKTENTLSSALIYNKKISDIKQAINIGDRFRFQRELFQGNGEDMNKTLHYINQLETLDEAKSFLQSKYSWDMENETVEDFFQIVKRRFL